MRAVRRALALAGVMVFAFPPAAMAVTGDQTTSAARIAVGAVGLVVSVILLLDVLALRRVAEGSMFGQNLVMVLVSVICLSASVLAAWVQLVLPGFTLEQVAFTRDLLIVASMIGMGIYFFGVRSAMLRFVRSYPGSDEDPGEQETPEAASAKDGLGTDA